MSKLKEAASEVVPVEYVNVLKEMKSEVKEKPLPDYCFVVLEGHPVGKRIGALKYNTKGYFDTAYDNEGLSIAQLRVVVGKLNDALGLTFAQRKAMTYGAYISWNAREAKPEFYETR